MRKSKYSNIACNGEVAWAESESQHDINPSAFNISRIGPKFPEGSKFIPQADTEEVFAKKIAEYYIWLFACFVTGSGIQTVPALGGFISATGTAPLRKSTLDYFTPMHQPMTESSVVRELLKRSEEATAEVGQKWVVMFW